MPVDVKIIRINKTEYSFGLSSRYGIRYVADALTFKNPDPFAYCHKIEKFDRKRKTFRIGMLENVIEYCREGKIDYEIDDKDFAYQVPDIEIDPRLTGAYQHQADAVRAFYRRRFGIIVVPTRGGKTFIAAEILRIFLATEKTGDFLFLVDNTTLFTQAVRDFQKFFEPYGGIEIGEIADGKFNIRRVTVGMVQTLQSALSPRTRDTRRQREALKYFRGLKFLCVDEIHDNCSDSRLKLYKKARQLDYLLCLSATPYRAETPVQNLKLQDWSGGVIYRITEAELRSRGVLSKYKVLMLMVDNVLENEPENADYAGLRDELIYRSPMRNGILLDVIGVLRELGLKTLVLFSSIEHGRMIAERTGIPFISGESKAKEREQRKDEFLRGEGGFLLASNIFKKGVTLPEVQVLINADGGLEDANTVQKKGRVLGATATKGRSAVIDFFDTYKDYFIVHSATRLETYVDAVGEKKVEVLNTGEKEWKKDMEVWLKRWFTDGGKIVSE